MPVQHYCHLTRIFSLFNVAGTTVPENSGGVLHPSLVIVTFKITLFIKEDTKINKNLLNLTKQETGDRRQESGVRSQESGVRSQESGVS